MDNKYPSFLRTTTPKIQSIPQGVGHSPTEDGGLRSQASDGKSRPNPARSDTRWGHVLRTFHRIISYGGKGGVASEPILSIGYRVEKMKKEEVEVTDFDRFWSAYPKRKGSNPKAPAAKKFTKIVGTGIDPESIIGGARKYAEDEKLNIGTPYIAQAITWLNQSRWQDYEFKPKPTSVSSRVFVREGTPQWRAWQAYKRTPCVNFGWYFPSEWPPQKINPEPS